MPLYNYNTYMITAVQLALYNSLSTFLQVGTIFGTPALAPGPSFDNPTEGIGRVIIFGIRFALIIGGILVLIYLLWGAFEYITSGGDEDQLTKSRQKMTNAVIGIIVMVAAVGIFIVVSDDVLGVIQRGPDGSWQFGLPTLRQCVGAGEVCNELVDCCSGLTCQPTTPNSFRGTCGP